MAVVDYVADWRSRLLSRLYFQFRDDPTWKLWCTDVIGPQAQDLEDAAQTLLGALDIDASQGLQLDLIGRLVGQPRGGVDDPTYRIYLRARIRANRSSGGPEDIYAVFAALLQLSAPGSMSIHDGGTASLLLTIVPPITDTQAQVGAIFLKASKDAGVRALLAWQEQPDAQTFTTAAAASLSAAVSIGASSLPITPSAVAKLPASGQVIVDAGVTGSEQLAYTAIVLGAGGGYSLTLSGTCANNHSLGATVELVGDPGLGWGDVNNPATGGQFAGEVQA
jgi:hypothetical protein